MKEIISKEKIKEFIKYNKCPKCNSTTNITKSGKRYNISKDIQIFRCRLGRHFFSIELDELNNFMEDRLK